MSPPPVILIGDSIRMSYEDGVARSLVGIARVWGPNVNCRSTRDILANLDEWVLRRAQPGAVVHLNAGLHDLRRLPETRGLPAVPIDEYAGNLRAIVDAIHTNGDISLLLATTTPVDDGRHRAARRCQRSDGDVLAYNRVLCSVAAAARVPVDDLYAVIATDRGRLIGDDGVHLSRDGAAAAGDAVGTAVRRALGRVG